MIGTRNKVLKSGETIPKLAAETVVDLLDLMSDLVTAMKGQRPKLEVGIGLRTERIQRLEFLTDRGQTADATVTARLSGPSENVDVRLTKKSTDGVDPCGATVTFIPNRLLTGHLFHVSLRYLTKET